MPNWVFTTLTVEGSEAEVKKFAEKARKSYHSYYEGHFGEEAGKVIEKPVEGAILFWNFKQPENKQAYFGKSDYKPEGYDDLSMEEKMAIAMRHSSDGWYDWNNREWGTKWEVSGSEVNHESYTDGKGSIQYRFDTAWSPATGAFEAIVEQHPELSFDIYCEEEQGWGVEFSGEDGELSVSREWDVPNSHADHEALDRADSCICNYEEDSDEWYDDCPNNPKEVAEAVQAFEDISELI